MEGCCAWEIVLRGMGGGVKSGFQLRILAWFGVQGLGAGLGFRV